MITTALLIALATAPASAAERPAPLPGPLTSIPWKPPEGQVATLSNGLEVVIVPDASVPVFEVRLLVGVGEYADPTGKEGLARGLFELAAEGTTKRSADDLSAAARRLGASISGELAWGVVGEVNATGLSRNLAATLDLWAEVVTSPAYSEAEVATWKAGRKTELQNAERSADTVAFRALQRIRYGDTYVGRAATPASTDAITSADLKALSAKHVGPDNAIVVVGGDVTRQQILPLLEARLGKWKPTTTEPAPVVAKPLPIEKSTVYFIDDPGAPQTMIVVASPGGTKLDPDHPARLVANEPFGGAFTSRVNLNLREDKGYSYGAQCGFEHLHGEGAHYCLTSVQTEVTQPALQELRGEYERMLGDRPLTDQEVADAKSGLAQRWPMSLEHLTRKLDLEVETWRFGLPEDRVATYVGEIQAVTTASANEAFRKTVKPDHQIWVVVGDGKKIRAGLDSLGMPVVELDRQGFPKGAATR